MSEARDQKRISRRHFLSVTGAGAVLATGFATSRAAASNKISHSVVRYQATPKGRQRCDNCAVWEPPSHCKLVEDPISPSGWCVLYRPAN
jgi:hypothetical protein